MLGYIEGKVVSKNNETLQCVVLVEGLGYEITLHKQLFEVIQLEEPLALWVHTQMKESVFSLYGFASEAEKQFFRILVGVSGLGPKGALSLLGEHGPEKLAQLILAKEADGLSSAPGIGKKSAQRIILELKNKIEKWTWISRLEGKLTEAEETGTDQSERHIREDLALALHHLGYQPTQVKQAVDKLFGTEDVETLGFEESLRQLLGTLSGRTTPKVRELNN